MTCWECQRRGLEHKRTTIGGDGLFAGVVVEECFSIPKDELFRLVSPTGEVQGRAMKDGTVLVVPPKTGAR